MPVMDGYTATRALRRNPAWQRLPVIAMTASALVEDRDRALAAGMNAHITKPISIDEMLRTMADWIHLRPNGQSAGSPAAAGGAIDRAEGMAYCMNNEALYERLLQGFRKGEADFVGDVGTAIADLRWNDAHRRVHDMKGLAGTLGATTLRSAAQKLQDAVTAQDREAARTELEAVDTALNAVFADIGPAA
jgi:CheY-like chemotaxis protein